ncbi:response regulator [Acidovorax sp. HMWF029]|jgi:CheY-like chemotaxis protein|uniref:Hpt domain-containing response regulator n=1 Tax=Acidovorax sp. HMWF029 TaxID=2056863 RepID=UPI001304B34A|nr:response regulator [Acidovorax sp. HMWF029]
MNLPRVLLVEDDASIARFVQLALEELPIELVTCTNVGDAMQALKALHTRLIITDLMLPGESGIDLVQRLLHEPSPGHPIPVAVFSAGLNPAVRDQLSAMKVWRMLSKPTSVLELETCVRDALALTMTSMADAPPCGTPTPATQTIPAAARTETEAEAIATHFAGDELLFKAYRASCLQQFPADIRQGDAACAAQDLPALRRLAHSLATVLLTLGYPKQSMWARQLENAAAQLAVDQCLDHWSKLRAFLTQL